MMRAITLWQPWAWAAIWGGKTVENRPRNMGYVGEVAIHVGLNWDERRVRADLTSVAGALRVSEREASADVLENNPITFSAMMRRQVGLIIGTVEIVTWVRLETLRGMQPWAFGPWCAVLRNARPIATPIPERTAFHRGIWTVPESVERDVRAQLGVSC